MQCFQGKSVYKGIVMGPVAVLKKNDYQVKRARIEDPEAEVKRVEEAVEVSKKQLGRLYDKAVREVGEASAAIFEVHQMMLEDEDYLESMENMIRTELVNAEYAAAATGDNFAEMFAAMDDEYMKARSADVKDISERLVRNLSGEGDNDLSSMEPSVIVADDLSPSETVQMDKEKILAFVTVHGSTNSHTAILARMMNIPALIGVPMDLNGLNSLQSLHNVRQPQDPEHSFFPDFPAPRFFLLFSALRLCSAFLLLSDRDFPAEIQLHASVPVLPPGFGCSVFSAFLPEIPNSVFFPFFQ